MNCKHIYINLIIIIIFLVYKVAKEQVKIPEIYNKFLLERYLKKYKFKYISTKKGNLDILKIDTYQYFKERGKIVSEAKKLQERFDKTSI